MACHVGKQMKQRVKGHDMHSVEQSRAKTLCLQRHDNVWHGIMYTDLSDTRVWEGEFTQWHHDKDQADKEPYVNGCHIIDGRKDLPNFQYLSDDRQDRHDSESDSRRRRLHVNVKGQPGNNDRQSRRDINGYDGRRYSANERKSQAEVSVVFVEPLPCLLCLDNLSQTKAHGIYLCVIVDDGFFSPSFERTVLFIDPFEKDLSVWIVDWGFSKWKAKNSNGIWRSKSSETRGFEFGVNLCLEKELCNRQRRLTEKRGKKEECKRAEETGYFSILSLMRKWQNCLSKG